MVIKGLSETGAQRIVAARCDAPFTLEDETGYVNVVVWHTVAKRQRRELLASRLMGIAGTIEREGAVVHLVAGGLFDYTPLPGRLVTRSRDFH